MRKELEETATRIRKKILQTVSKNGGHLSSTLGAVDLIIAMHYVFEPSQDPFIFDVSHQAYAHKLLTNRWEDFHTLRQFGGISGYVRPSESPYDYFSAGHSSTSLSVAVGAAKAIALKKEPRVPVVLIGDGSMSAGMAYEALNELGERRYPVVIILNDNEMSIGKPIGAISNYLTKLKAGKFYQGFKGKFKKLLEHLPQDATLVAQKMDMMWAMNGVFFEEMGLEYIGPVDGHNLEELIEVFERAKELKKPVVIHAKTVKGKGYKEAEGYYEHWHGVGPFDLEKGEIYKNGKLNATKVFSESLLALAREHEDVVGVTAAMPSGTGMKELITAFPERFWDVAIAEQHAVTSMAAMAKEGFKPFAAIYSTFLQRAYDQIIHDVCLDGYPVVFAIDRAGIVGADGETHQGVFDVNFLRLIPRMILFAPRDFATLRESVTYAYTIKDSPSAFRYPRGGFLHEGRYASKGFTLGKAELLEEGEGTLLVGYGCGVGKATSVRDKLLEKGIKAALVDLRFVKPLDEEMLLTLSKEYQRWYVFSHNAKLGGVGELLQSFVCEKNLDVQVESFEYTDQFITHGEIDEVESSLGTDIDTLGNKIYQSIGKV